MSGLAARSNVKDCWCGTWEFSFLTFDSPDGAGVDDLLGHSITYRIALGAHRGRNAFTLQTVPAVAGGDDSCAVAKAAGFSLHAGVTSEAHEREKLERLCRYITRPAISTERLSLTAQGNIRYRLVAPAHPCARDIRASLHIKTPYRDGTTDVVFEPLEVRCRSRPAAQTVDISRQETPSRGVLAVAPWNFGVNGGNPPRLFLLIGFEFNNSNGRPRQKGRLYFLVCSSVPEIVMIEGAGVGGTYVSIGPVWAPTRIELVPTPHR